MTQGFNTQNRPTQNGYQAAFDNKGKYGASNQRPYINPSVPMYVPQAGQNCVRIVDPLELIELGVYFFDVYFHRSIGYKNDYFLCDKEHGKGPCPRCELVTPDLWEKDKDMAKEYSPEMRRLLWVLDLQKPQEANVLKLWSCPRTLSDEVLTQSRQPDQNIFIDVAHPELGVPVFFTRTGAGLNTKYTGVQIGQQAYPIGEDVAYQRFEFNDILMWHTYDEFAAALNLNPDAGASDGAAPGGYEAAPNLPANEMGAADAAAASRATTAGPSGPTQTGAVEYDYSDLEKIDPNNKECFRSQYEAFEECAACPDNALCKLPWPTIPGAGAGTKTAKTPTRTPKTPTGAGAGPSAPANSGAPTGQKAPIPPNNPSGPGGAGGNKIADAQERLRQEIAQRKAN